MEPFTFTILYESEPSGEFSLAPCPPDMVSDTMWAELAARFTSESSLLPYPAALLTRRWQEGYAAVAVYQGQIISHICLAPIAQRLPGPDSWSAIPAFIGKEDTELPKTDVYECRSSWTDPDWRGKGISPSLHAYLIERWIKENTLGLSGMLGHASPTLARLGWQSIPWEAFPFVSSLIAVPGEEFQEQTSLAWCLPRDLKLPQGSNPPSRQIPKDLEPECWVSSPASAIRLNENLDGLLGGDLQGWRRAIVSAFCTPRSRHRMVFIF